MANKNGSETLNSTLRDLRANERQMKGVVILFAGDFRQILSVEPRGTKNYEINTYLQTSIQ